MKNLIWKIISPYFYAQIMHIRGKGWFACEDMVYNRIKREYPEQADKLIMDLLA